MGWFIDKGKGKTALRKFCEGVIFYEIAPFLHLIICLVSIEKYLI